MWYGATDLVPPPGVKRLEAGTVKGEGGMKFINTLFEDCGFDQVQRRTVKPGGGEE